MVLKCIVSANIPSVSEAVLIPLSSIFKKIFSGIISITSLRVGIDKPPFNSTFLIESNEICSINGGHFGRFGGGKK